MQDPLDAFSQAVNFTRYRGQAEGHYESFFVRANHPSSRAGVLDPLHDLQSQGTPQLTRSASCGRSYFDAERNHHVAAKQEYRFADCEFGISSFQVRVGKATLRPGRLEGAIEGTQHRLAWELKFEGASPPLLLLPLALYQGRFPAAKSVVSLPHRVASTVR